MMKCSNKIDCSGSKVPAFCIGGKGTQDEPFIVATDDKAMRLVEQQVPKRFCFKRGKKGSMYLIPAFLAEQFDIEIEAGIVDEYEVFNTLFDEYFISDIEDVIFENPKV